LIGRPRYFVAPAFVAWLAAVPMAFAQDLTCKDVEFDSSTTEAFPSVARACHSVVERDDGKLYVRLVADVVRVKADGSIMLDLKTRDGSKIRQEFHPPPGFRAIISGESKPTRALHRGQEIRLYLPSSAWRVRDESAPGTTG
jgi:hypothetical protein